MTKAAKKPDLAILIAHWRSNDITPAQIESLVDQTGRLISWRLQQKHHRGFGWHDLHQQCWLAIARALVGKAWRDDVKPSTQITALVDATVQHEHQAHTLNTWDCTIEAVKRMGHGDYEHNEKVEA